MKTGIAHRLLKPTLAVWLNCIFVFFFSFSTSECALLAFSWLILTTHELFQETWQLLVDLTFSVMLLSTWISSHFHSISLLFLKIFFSHHFRHWIFFFLIFNVWFYFCRSYTAIEYNKRSPRPQNPLQRPTYQGANRIFRQTLLFCQSNNENQRMRKRLSLDAECDILLLLHIPSDIGCVVFESTGDDNTIFCSCSWGSEWWHCKSKHVVRFTSHFVTSFVVLYCVNCDIKTLFIFWLFY